MEKSEWEEKVLSVGYQLAKDIFAEEYEKMSTLLGHINSANYKLYFYIKDGFQYKGLYYITEPTKDPITGRLTDIPSPLHPTLHNQMEEYLYLSSPFINKVRVIRSFLLAVFSKTINRSELIKVMPSNLYSAIDNYFIPETGDTAVRLLTQDDIDDLTRKAKPVANLINQYKMNQLMGTSELE